MKGLFKQLRDLLGLVCLATLLAQLAFAGWLWYEGRLSRQRMAQLVAVLYGVDLFQHPPPTAAAPLSVDAVATARAVKFRELELREQALTQRQLLLDRQQLQLQAEAERFQIAKRQFERTLASWQEQQQSQALEETAALLAGMKPKQAKEQLLLMLQRGELESVVTLLTALPPGNRAKVVAEFQSPEDTKWLADVVQRLRDATPQQAMVDKARAGMTSGAGE